MPLTKRPRGSIYFAKIRGYINSETKLYDDILRQADFNQYSDLRASYFLAPLCKNNNPFACKHDYLQITKYF